MAASPRSRHGRLASIARASAAVAWAERSLRAARRALPTQGLGVRIDPPARAFHRLTPIVERWLHWRDATCLERALLLQAWYVALGQPHDVLIGVADVTDQVLAHAWLDHEDPLDHAVLTRVRPPSA